MLDNKFPLITSRLVIRHVEESDFVALFMLMKNRFLNLYFQWPSIETTDEMDEYYSQFYYQAYKDNPQTMRYGIELKYEQRFIGLLNIDPTEGAYRLEVAIHPSLWDNGLAYEACLRVIEILKNEGIPYLTAPIDVDNVAAIQLVNKLRFTYRYSYQQIIAYKCKGMRMYQLDLNNDNCYEYNNYLTLALYHRKFIENLDD